jgi:hypothetical protein
MSVSSCYFCAGLESLGKDRRIILEWLVVVQYLNSKRTSRDSSVGIGTGYGLYGPDVYSRQGK